MIIVFSVVFSFSFQSYCFPSFLLPLPFCFCVVVTWSSANKASRRSSGGFLLLVACLRQNIHLGGILAKNLNHVRHRVVHHLTLPREFHRRIRPKRVCVSFLSSVCSFSFSSSSSAPLLRPISFFARALALLFPCTSPYLFRLLDVIVAGVQARSEALGHLLCDKESQQRLDHRRILTVRSCFHRVLPQLIGLGKIHRLSVTPVLLIPTYKQRKHSKILQITEGGGERKLLFFLLLLLTDSLQCDGTR